MHKLSIILILLSIWFISQANAQDIRIGAIGGANLSSLSDGTFKEINVGDAGFAYHIGGVIEYNLIKNIALRPKLLVSQQGDFETRDVNNQVVSSSDLNYKLTYANIPLQVKFFSKPYIIVGPQVGFLVGTEKGENDFGELDNSFDYGLSLGVGYDINDFFVEANFYQGLQTLITLPNGAIPVGGTDDLTNTVFQFSIGYFFN